MVAARETTLQELLEGSKQYQVPLYQRTYSWTKPQLARLWEDILQLGADRVERPGLTHFIGSLVLAPSPANGPAGVAEYLVVDGQQRLTTLSILLCAIRDHRAKTESAEHRQRIDQLFLTNPWKGEQHRLKLLPTQADRDSYRACVDATVHAGGSDPIGVAYRFFATQLVAADDPDDPLDIGRIEDAVIAGLSLVSVTAQRGDNAHRIFESLNNTGLRLTQSDLLRNYLFMRLPTRTEAVYQSLWLPLQDALSTNDLELLFWLDLVQRDARVKQSDIYSGQQARLDRLESEAEIEAEVARFAQLGALLATILDPTRESHGEVRRRLERLNSWGTTTVYPLLLHLFERRAAGTASSDQLAAAMLCVESFFVRRLLVGRATSNLNRILLSIVTEMDPSLPVDQAVRAELSTGRKYYATDDELRAALPSVPFYLNGRPRQRALVLQWIEESFGSKEPVDPASLTIEHVLPQTPTATWNAAVAVDLGPDESVEDVYEALVHTLGNLTLTGYNAELSNADFAVKRQRLAASGIAMNKEIAELDRWGRPEIHQRAVDLAERVAAIWPGPIRGSARSSVAARWDLLDQALAELPAGSWTSYGDVAALIGSHPVPVGERLANHVVPNAHRVLRVDGTVSPGFRWVVPTMDVDPMKLLQSEGVEFDEHDRANPNQRIMTDDLAQLLSIEIDEPVPTLPVSGGGKDGFAAQLAQHQPAAVVDGVTRVLERWIEAGGELDFGSGNETSCFFMSTVGNTTKADIWPLTIYPSGRCEVVFQHLARRPPFDDRTLREELRQKLNTIDGVDLPAAKIELRPSFPLAVLAAPNAQSSLADHLSWFRTVCAAAGTDQ